MDFLLPYTATELPDTVSPTVIFPELFILLFSANIPKLSFFRSISPLFANVAAGTGFTTPDDDNFEYIPRVLFSVERMIPLFNIFPPNSAESRYIPIPESSTSITPVPVFSASAVNKAVLSASIPIPELVLLDFPAFIVPLFFTLAPSSTSTPMLPVELVISIVFPPDMNISSVPLPYLP